MGLSCFLALQPCLDQGTRKVLTLNSLSKISRNSLGEGSKVTGFQQLLCVNHKPIGRDHIHPMSLFIIVGFEKGQQYSLGTVPLTLHSKNENMGNQILALRLWWYALVLARVW